MRVRPHREEQLPLLRERLLEAVDRRSLVAAPAVVRERADLRLRAEVDLLLRAGADVADPEVAGLAVEREAPRVAQSERDHLPRRARARRVDAQHLPERRRHVLRAVLGVVADDAFDRAAVAHADVEEARRGRTRAARRCDSGAAARRRAASRVAFVAELTSITLRVALQVGVVGVEEMVPRVRRVERDREEPALLVVGRDAVVDVEERPGDDASLHDLHAPRLLDDVERRRVARRARDVGRIGEPRRDLLERERARRRGAAARGRARAEAGDERGHGCGRHRWVEGLHVRPERRMCMVLSEGPLSRMSTGPLLALDLDRRQPLGLQIERQLRALVRAGGLPVGRELPSTRALAADLGVSRGVVVGAYAQLAAEGYLIAAPRRRAHGRRGRARAGRGVRRRGRRPRRGGSLQPPPRPAGLRALPAAAMAGRDARVAAARGEHGPRLRRAVRCQRRFAAVSRRFSRARAACSQPTIEPASSPARRTRSSRSPRCCASRERRGSRSRIRVTAGGRVSFAPPASSSCRCPSTRTASASSCSPTTSRRSSSARITSSRSASRSPRSGGVRFSTGPSRATGSSSSTTTTATSATTGRPPGRCRRSRRSTSPTSARSVRCSRRRSGSDGLCCRRGSWNRR